MSNFETETALTNVFQDQNGWYRVETADVGRLDTKDPGLARAAYDLWQQQKRVHVKGKEDKVNKDGRWFTNRYLNAIQEAQAAWSGGPSGGDGFGNLTPEIPMAPPRPQQPQQQGSQQDEEKEGRIVREVCAKLAVWSIPHLPEHERSFAHQIRVAEAWRAYIYGGARAVGVAPLGGPTPRPPDPEVPVYDEDTGAVFAGSNSPEYQHPADANIPF